MTTYNKYTWVCTGDCDALIEYTFKDGFGWPNGVMDLTCPCNSKCTLLSVEDATIQPTNERNTMLDNLEASMNGMTTENLPLSDAEKYNPNLLVTYKVIHGYSDAEYATDKVSSIEWDLHNGRENNKKIQSLRLSIDSVKEIISEAYPDSEDQDTLRAIAEALNIELTKTVEFTATVEVTGTVEIDLLADYGTDVETEVMENLYVEAQSGNIEIDEQYVTNVREC
jgi:hypothetical protein